MGEKLRVISVFLFKPQTAKNLM